MTTARDKSPLDLMEEAGYLLRNAPPQAVAAYYLGTLPFLLAFLFFWADMSRNPYAYEHCAPAAFGLAILFAWMSAWQAVFAQALRSRLTGAPSAPFKTLAFIESVLQPTKFVVIPLAFLITVPLGAAFAFYQNLFAISYTRETGVKQSCAAAWRQAKLRQTQNWTVLGIAAMLTIIVFANVAAALILAPKLLKSFLGIETPLTQGAVSPLNSTFLAIALALTYAIVDPLMKTIYVLRCFYGESQVTGEDLRARMNSIGAILRHNPAVDGPVFKLLDPSLYRHRAESSHSATIFVLLRPIRIVFGCGSAALYYNRAESSHSATIFVGRTPWSALLRPIRIVFGCGSAALWGRLATCGRLAIGLFGRARMPQQADRESALHQLPPPCRAGLLARPRTLRHRATTINSGPLPSPPALLLLLLVLFSASPSQAQQTPPPPQTTPAMNQRQLDRSIDDVLKRSEFAWRLPPRPHRQENKSWMMRTLSAWFDKMAEWWDQFIDWLNEKARSHRVSAPEKGPPPAMRPWYYVLIGAIVLVTLFAFLRSFRRRTQAAAQAEAIVVATPDLASEETTADQLPADEWLRAAREYAARNDVRLAVRALYLATLAHLGGSSLIAISRGKTNQEYTRELRRRAKARPEILPAFNDTVAIFERSWYGMYDVDIAAMARVEGNLSTMRSGVE